MRMPFSRARRMISPRSRVTLRQMGVPTSMTGSCISRLISSLSGSDRLLAHCCLAVLRKKDRENDDARHWNESEELPPATAPGVPQPARTGGQQWEKCGEEKYRGVALREHRCRCSREKQEEDEPPVFGSRRSAVEVCVLGQANANGLLKGHRVPSSSAWSASFRFVS